MTLNIEDIVRKEVGTIYALRLSYDDAVILANDMFTPNLDQVKAIRRRSQGDEEMFRPLGEIIALEVRKLTTIPDRRVWVKRRGSTDVFYIETPLVLDIKDLPDADQLPQALAEQEEAARRLAGFLSHTNTRQIIPLPPTTIDPTKPLPFYGG